MQTSLDQFLVTADEASENAPPKALTSSQSTALTLHCHPDPPTHFALLQSARRGRPLPTSLSCSLSLRALSQLRPARYSLRPSDFTRAQSTDGALPGWGVPRRETLRGYIADVQFDNHTGSLLAAASTDGRVEVHEPRALQNERDESLRVRLDCGATSCLEAVAWPRGATRDTSLVVAARNDTLLRLYDLEVCEEDAPTKVVAASGSGVLGAAFLPGSSDLMIVGARRGWIEIVDLRIHARTFVPGRNPLQYRSGPAGTRVPVWDVSCRPLQAVCTADAEGRTVVAADATGYIRVCDTRKIESRMGNVVMGQRPLRNSREAAIVTQWDTRSLSAVHEDFVDHVSYMPGSVSSVVYQTAGGDYFGQQSDPANGAPSNVPLQRSKPCIYKGTSGFPEIIASHGTSLLRRAILDCGSSSVNPQIPFLNTGVPVASLATRSDGLNLVAGLGSNQVLMLSS